MTFTAANALAFKRAAQAISKLPGASSLSTCQSALAQACGYRDFFHIQKMWNAVVRPEYASIETQVSVTARLHKITSLQTGFLLDALTRTRFFGPNPDPATSLAVREALFERLFPASDRKAVGSPCRIQAPGYHNARAMVVLRGEDPDRRSRAMFDHGILDCVSGEIPAHRAGRVFIPLRFWMPYGYWVEEDGSQVLFSRDYCPLWKVQNGAAPVRDDPDRWVKWTKQEWFFDECSFRGETDRVIAQGLQILRDHRVTSLPRLVEWFPECLAKGKWISNMKNWGVWGEGERAG